MKTKVCKDCQREFPHTTDHFHRNGSGTLRHICKECAIQRVLKWQHENPVTESRYPYSKKWVAANRHKKSAHQKVYYAIKRGHLTRQPCEICGGSDVHAHHDDYAKPLEVRWLCNKHHNFSHRA